MKKSIQFLNLALFLAFFSINLSAGNITLQINHTVGDDVLEMTNGVYEQEATGQVFNITRCQYFISEIQLVHDGGQTIDLTDLYLLVNANQTDYDLGEHENITNLEAINFNIGVPEDMNHGDPSIWPVTHPLGLSTPSMHWGWAAGYRFIALEGQTNPISNGTTTFQFHAVADKYYTPVGLETIGVINDGDDAKIVVESDIQKLITGITLQGNIEHGEGPSNAQIIGNFAFNDVFSYVETAILYAPTLEVNSSTSNLTGDTNDNDLSSTITATNISTETQVFEWAHNSIDLPEGWTFEVCAPNNDCVEESNGTFEAESGDFNLTAVLRPNGIVGSGQAVIDVINPQTAEVIPLTWSYEVELASGINDLPFSQNVQVYPNPAKALVNVEYDFSNIDLPNNNYSFVITDLNGKIVYQENTLNAAGKIVLNEELSNGVYLYQFFGDAQLLSRDRLVILE